MKRIFIFALAAVVVSACGKNFQEEIDSLNDKYSKIEERVNKLEEQVSGINGQLEKLSVLATAAQTGMYVTQVKTSGDRYELTLSNGRVIVLQEGPSGTLASSPNISMVNIGGSFYWTVNGMMLTDANGLPMPATGPTPVVQYNKNTRQWVVSVDGGMTFQSLNVYASITINDEILLQVINNYVSSHSTTLISNEVLFQVISTYIQQNYSKLFNVSIMKQVVVSYLDENYTTIFNYQLLEQLFNQYNFEYSAQHIDVDIITSILLTFIQEHEEIFVNNEILYEIISNYINVNKIDIFNNELVIEVINEYIQSHTDFINIELMKQIVNNYIDEHQEIIFNNENLLNVLIEYIQENYTLIFSQDILYQVLNQYVTKNRTTIFNDTLIQEIMNTFVENNITQIINNDILFQIVNEYVTQNKTTFIDEDVLYEVINNFFQKNYNLVINESFIRNVINYYVEQNKTTIIDIDIVDYVVKNYVQYNYQYIFNTEILNQIISNYFEQNTTVIQQYITQTTGVIKEVTVDNEMCTVKLSGNQIIQLVVYDAYANVRDRVQSIVLIPNANGHITHSKSADYVDLRYLVTPPSMAGFIANNLQKRIGAEIRVLSTNPALGVSYVTYSDYKYYSVASKESGVLTVRMTGLKSNYQYNKAVSLHIFDSAEGGTDYSTPFTPIDWN
ncbi:MAG: hypothetical protein J5737_05010 [Bacteroidales bacterium]|nr:hypothetical protein [Bacteroidales bacterium]